MRARNLFALYGLFLLVSSLLALGLAASAGAVDGESTTVVVEVRDSFTGQGLAGICVSITDYDLFEFFGTTAADGSVSTVVPPGDYGINVWDCDNGVYSDEFFDFVNISGGGTIIFNVDLISPVTVSGTVTDLVTGDPLYRMCVDVFHPNQYWFGSGEYRALTDESGSYSMTVTLGEFFFRFSDCGDGDYVDMWLETPPWSVEAEPVDLNGATEFEVNGALTPAGFIAGTVTNQLTGNPVSGVCVSVESVVEGDSSEGDDEVSTGPDGTYQIGGLSAGEYVVRFYDCRGGDLISEYHLDASSREDATPVAVASGIVTAVDAALAPAASISGSIIDADTGDPVTDTCVWLQNADSPINSSVKGTSTNGQGRYEFTEVRPGSYRVLFSPPLCAHSHGAEWYLNASDVADAAIIDVGPGEDITGIDGVLSQGGTISGAVTDEAGNPIYATVEVHHEGWPEPLTTLAFEGRFTTNPLPVGDYQVRFWDQDYVYIAEWYDNALSPADATSVSIVTKGQNITGIDANLTVGGRVRGNVIGLNYPSELLCVNVYDLESRLIRFGNTGPEGSFHIGALPTDQYRMNTAPCPPRDPVSFLTVWYGGSLSESTSALVDISAGQTTWNIDFIPTRFPGFNAEATVALVEDSGRWHTINGDANGATFYFGLPSDLPVLGDWDCDGVDTPGMFRPSNGFFYLGNSRATSLADEEFFFGQEGDIPLAGDWNGDGCDTVGIYRPAESKVYLRNSLTTGIADIEYYFGQPGDSPFAGDFDGNGTDEVALHREASGRVYLRFSHTNGPADLDFFFGTAGDLIFSGDWNGDGIDTLGVYRPASSEVFLNFGNTTATADAEFSFGHNTLHPAI